MRIFDTRILAIKGIINGLEKYIESLEYNNDSEKHEVRFVMKEALHEISIISSCEYVRKTRNKLKEDEIKL